MPARRLILLVAVLTGLFVLGVALAVGGLLALRDPGVVVVCAIALLSGVLAAGLSFLAARAVIDEPDEDLPRVDADMRPSAPQAPRPVRIQSLPVADLPAPYLAAVMKGLQASRTATRSPQQP